MSAFLFRIVFVFIRNLDLIVTYYHKFKNRLGFGFFSFENICTSYINVFFFFLRTLKTQNDGLPATKKSISKIFKTAKLKFAA